MQFVGLVYKNLFSYLSLQCITFQFSSTTDNRKDERENLIRKNGDLRTGDIISRLDGGIDDGDIIFTSD